MEEFLSSDLYRLFLSEAEQSIMVNAATVTQMIPGTLGDIVSREQLIGAGYQLTKNLDLFVVLKSSLNQRKQELEKNES